MRKNKILFISFINSIHSARWINQLKYNPSVEIFIFPSKFALKSHPDLAHLPSLGPLNWLGKLLFFLKLESHIFKFEMVINKLLDLYFPNYLSNRLYRMINLYNPDIIHTLETQHAGYLMERIYSKLDAKKINWWHTNWGSDFYVFQNFDHHKLLIKSLLSHVNYYSCECERDVLLAKKLGYAGIVFPVHPNTGGFDLSVLESHNVKSLPTSKRRVILLKGYQGWAGRALFGIRALERCKDLLDGYSIKLYSVASNAVDIQTSVAIFHANTGISIEILPNNLSHDKMIELHASARISIGLSIGDGISTSLLESMAAGSFPIQSNSSCCSDWFENFKTGISVHAEDTDEIEKAIRHALMNDEMVDLARELNFEKISKSADYKILQQVAIGNYNRILNKEI